MQLFNLHTQTMKLAEESFVITFILCATFYSCTVPHFSRRNGMECFIIVSVLSNLGFSNDPCTHDNTVPHWCCCWKPGSENWLQTSLSLQHVDCGLLCHTNAGRSKVRKKNNNSTNNNNKVRLRLSVWPVLCDIICFASVKHRLAECTTVTVNQSLIVYR